MSTEESQRISRRRFMQAAAIAGAGLGLGGVLNACTTATTPTAAPSTTSAAPAVVSTTAPAPAAVTQLKTPDDILAAAKKFSGTTVNVAVVGTSPPFKPLVEELEAKAGIKTVVTELPVGAMFEKLILEFTSGAGTFDIAHLLTTDMAAFAPYLQDLADLNKKYALDETDLMDCFKWYANYPYPGGKFTAIPWDGDMYILYYRSDWFEKAGLDPAKPPATYDQMLEWARLFHGKDMNGNGKPVFGYVPRMRRVQNYYWWAAKMAAWGGDWFDKNWKPTVNAPECVAALEFCIKLKEVAPPNAVELGYADVNRMFMAGEAAFVEQFQDLSNAARDPKNSQVVGKYRTAVLPAGPGGKRPYLAGGVTGGISKISKNQEAAYLWLRWMREPGNTQKTALASAVDPTWKSAYQDPNFQKQYGDTVSTWKVALDTASSNFVIPPVVPETAALLEVLDLKLSEAYSGQTPPQQALNDVALQWTTTMGRAGYYQAGRAPYAVQKK